MVLQVQELWTCLMPRPLVKLAEKEHLESPPVTSTEAPRQNFCKELNIMADSEIDDVRADNCMPVVDDHKDVNPWQVFLLWWYILSVLIRFIFSKGMITKGALSVSVKTAQNLCLTHRHLLSLIQNHFKKYFPKAKSLIWFTLFSCLISQSSGGRLITSSQPLPSDCLEWFMSRQDCPIKAYWDPSWNDHWGKLNHTCCSGFPGTELHCQRNHSVNFPACLPNEKVPRGYKGQLVKDENGNPRFQIAPCDSGTFEPEDTISSNVTFPYCSRRKSRCTGDKQRLCFGGPAADDLCTCAPGHRSVGEGCDQGFTDHNISCWCEPFTCPDGQVPGPPMVQTGLNCSDPIRDRFSPNNMCVSVSADTSPQSTLSTDAEPERVTPSVAYGNAESHDKTNPVGRVFKCLLGIICIITFVFVCLGKWSSWQG